MRPVQDHLGSLSLMTTSPSSPSASLDELKSCLWNCNLVSHDLDGFLRQSFQDLKIILTAKILMWTDYFCGGLDKNILEILQHSRIFLHEALKKINQSEYPLDGDPDTPDFKLKQAWNLLLTRIQSKLEENLLKINQIINRANEEQEDYTRTLGRSLAETPVPLRGG